MPTNPQHYSRLLKEHVQKFSVLVSSSPNGQTSQVMVDPDADSAMTPVGGIDLNKADEALQLQTQDGEEGITFKIDPAMLAQYENAPGFTPEVVSMEPLPAGSLKAFLVGTP